MQSQVLSTMRFYFHNLSHFLGNDSINIQRDMFLFAGEKKQKTKKQEEEDVKKEKLVHNFLVLYWSLRVLKQLPHHSRSSLVRGLRIKIYDKSIFSWCRPPRWRWWQCFWCVYCRVESSECRISFFRMMAHSKRRIKSTYRRWNFLSHKHAFHREQQQQKKEANITHFIVIIIPLTSHNSW